MLRRQPRPALVGQAAMTTTAAVVVAAVKPIAATAAVVTHILVLTQGEATTMGSWMRMVVIAAFTASTGKQWALTTAIQHVPLDTVVQ